MMVPNFGSADLFELLQVAVALIALIFHVRCTVVALREQRYQREAGVNGAGRLVARTSVFTRLSLAAVSAILLAIAVNMALTSGRAGVVALPFDVFHLNRLALVVILLILVTMGWAHIALRAAVLREMAKERKA